jgi:hypothetical protein
LYSQFPSKFCGNQQQQQQQLSLLSQASWGYARDETHKKQGKEKHKAQEHKSTKEKGKIMSEAH